MQNSSTPHSSLFLFRSPFVWFSCAFEVD